jgi:hypothetical protein
VALSSFVKTELELYVALSSFVRTELELRVALSSFVRTELELRVAMSSFVTTELEIRVAMSSCLTAQLDRTVPCNFVERNSLSCTLLISVFYVIVLEISKDIDYFYAQYSQLCDSLLTSLFGQNFINVKIKPASFFRNVGVNARS